MSEFEKFKHYADSLPGATLARMQPEIELQLLIIDLGDCCVVKVERGANFELLSPVSEGNWHWAVGERATIVPKSEPR